MFSLSIHGQAREFSLMYENKIMTLHEPLKYSEFLFIYDKENLENTSTKINKLDVNKEKDST